MNSKAIRKPQVAIILSIVNCMFYIKGVKNSTRPQLRGCCDTPITSWITLNSSMMQDFKPEVVGLIMVERAHAQ